MTQPLNQEEPEPGPAAELKIFTEVEASLGESSGLKARISELSVFGIFAGPALTIFASGGTGLPWGATVAIAGSQVLAGLVVAVRDRRSGQKSAPSS